jgi:hypothetical protein
LFNRCPEPPQKLLENWQKTSLQQLINTSAFRPFEIDSKKVITKEERQEKKKNIINERSRRKRLEFARVYVNKAIDFWKTVLFIDESKFNISGSDSPQYVWRKPKKELDPRNVIPTVKHGGRRSRNGLGLYGLRRCGRTWNC